MNAALQGRIHSMGRMFMRAFGEIADDLAVAHSMAKYHVLKLYRPLDVSEAVEALARARRR